MSTDAPRTQKPAAPTEPTWREHVEQRLWAWKHSQMNYDGDRLSLIDVLDAGALDDLIDFVCDEWAEPAAPAKQEPASLTDEEIEAIADDCEALDPTDSFWKQFARAIEAALSKQEPAKAQDPEIPSA